MLRKRFFFHMAPVSEMVYIENRPFQVFRIQLHVPFGKQNSAEKGPSRPKIDFFHKVFADLITPHVFVSMQTASWHDSMIVYAKRPVQKSEIRESVLNDLQVHTTGRKTVYDFQGSLHVPKGPEFIISSFQASLTECVQNHGVLVTRLPKSS